jgi:hypothetical protein
MSGQHAPFAPSSAHRYLVCPGSHRAEAQVPDSETDDAALGTLAHELAAYCLRYRHRPQDYLGLAPAVLAVERIWRKPEGDELTVDAEMVEHVTAYVQTIESLAEGHTLLIEQKLDILPPDVWGTADAVILRDDGEAIIIDLKYGRGVRVVALNNAQLKCYALGVMREYDGLLGDIRQVRGMIYQPRNGGASEDVWTREQLAEFSATLANGIAACRAGDAPRIPDDHACTFCRYFGQCPEARERVYQLAAAGFSDVSEAGELGTAMGRVEYVEKWCKAVRAEVERRLINGQAVPGWKLVQGRARAREWLNEEAAEAALKGMRLKFDQMYTANLKSPTQIEAQLKKDHPRQWAKVQPLIAPRIAGAPSVAPESDPRPALQKSAPADGFVDVIQ